MNVFTGPALRNPRETVGAHAVRMQTPAGREQRVAELRAYVEFAERTGHAALRRDSEKALRELGVMP